MGKDQFNWAGGDENSGMMAVNDHKWTVRRGLSMTLESQGCASGVLASFPVLSRPTEYTLCGIHQLLRQESMN